MKLQVIGSSSKGNCYILKSAKGSLLLECGISIKEISKAIDFNYSDIVGCVISHEHMDHCKSVYNVMGMGIDCYMSEGTSIALNVKGHRVKILNDHNFPVEVGNFYIVPFATEHDAKQPLGFLIQEISSGEKLLFATDTYYIRYNFPGINYIMIECNYVPEILYANVEAGLVSEFRKDRLLKSHFSLDNVLEFIKANDMSTVKKIILMHLSDENSNAVRMIAEISALSQRSVVIADPGMVIDLSKAPF